MVEGGWSKVDGERSKLKVMVLVEGGRLKVEGFRNSKIEFRVAGSNKSQKLGSVGYKRQGLRPWALA